MAAEVLVTPLTRIINTSISTAIFPDRWKVAKVIPLYKRASKKEVINYHPVSPLPVASKILEAVHTAKY